MDCENLSFSEKLSSQRIAKAENALGKTIVQKIITFALYLLGVDRATIALQLSIPPGTIRSLVRSFNNKGLAALFDKRTKTSLPKVKPIPESSEPRIEENTDFVKIIFGVGKQIINIPISNQFQKRIVLLTLLNSKILKRADVAKTLGLSEDRTIKLARKLTQNDATGIADQRQGQQMDFLYTPKIKAEIIQQFVIDIITQGHISGKQLSKNLEERCQIVLSSRSILHHISKLGLRDIRSSLPHLLEEAKKKIVKILKSLKDNNNLRPFIKTPYNQLQPRYLLRMQMMVLLNNQYNVLAVSIILRLHPKTVSFWNNRFKAGGGVQDLARSGRPPKITFEIVQKVIAFYCQHNPLPGCSRWSIRWMAVYFQKNPEYLGVSISASSIRCCLSSNKFRLYRRKYFLQICDPFFFEKMEKIIQIYKLNPEYLFCLDECTGLQALERTAPSLPADSIRPEYREFEYIRHGTVSIISILEKRSGKVYTECIPDHTSVTIINSVKKHATQYDSSKTLHYICDNYSSHSTEGFCQGIAELCNIPLPKLKTAHDRKQWLESDNKRIIFHFLPTHGSWLNLIEIWFAILQQKALSKESFSSTNQLENAILDFTETWNTDFAHPFNWKYSGEDLYDKVVCRLIRWLELETSQMTVKFLGKQLKLMHNLFANHYSKIKESLWLKLQKTLNDKREYILKIINTVDPDETKNAQLKRQEVQALYLASMEQLDVSKKAA